MTLLKSGAILVVGGRGMLGRYITLDLIDSQDIQASQVHILDKTSSTQNDVDGAVYHEGDITDRHTVEEVIKSIRPVTIFNVASPKPFAHDLEYYLNVNVHGTRNLIEVAQQVGSTQAFIYTSSSSVVHDAISDLHSVDETAPVLFMPQQREAYHHSKALAEDLVLENNDRRPSRMRTVSIRPSGIFGKEDTTTLIPLIENAKAGKQKFQIGDGTNLFDWTYVENAARAHILAAEALLRTFHQPSSIEIPMKVEGEAFFITNDEPVPFWQFVRDVGAAAGYPTPKAEIIVIPKLIGLTMGLVIEWMTWAFTLGTKKATFTLRGAKYSTQIRTFDIDKAKKRLGYRPFISMSEGIQKATEGSALPQVGQAAKTKVL